MAKSSMRDYYKNAVIDVDDMTLTEITKEETRVYDLNKILKKWDKIEGISIIIAKDSEIPPDKSG